MRRSSKELAPYVIMAVDSDGQQVGAAHEEYTKRDAIKKAKALWDDQEYARAGTTRVEVQQTKTGDIVWDADKNYSAAI